MGKGILKFLNNLKKDSLDQKTKNTSTIDQKFLGHYDKRLVNYETI